MSSRKNTDEFIRGVNQSLAAQVQDELSQSKKGRGSASSSHKKKKRKKKKKIPTFLKVLLSLLLVLTLGFGFLVFTPAGRSFLIQIATEYAYSKIDYDGADDLDEEGYTITTNINPALMSSTFLNAKHDEEVINILLLGVEAIGYGETGGHTDSIMIATMNMKNNTLKLTSIMRDSYVEIPGYDGNRINGVYAKGGVPLLYETIAQNFDLQLDGYALVGFDAFEDVIDAIGGIKITLTAEEAKYLNTTNYISNKKYRNVKEGSQTLNGNQALGYCRVRYVPTLDGSRNDMGRTSRQRRVISAIFDKCKSAGITELISLMNSVLPLVKTDINKQNCKAYLAAALEIGLKDKTLENLRLPADKEFSSQRIRKMAVIVPDWPLTQKRLHDFIFIQGNPVSPDTEDPPKKE